MSNIKQANINVTIKDFFFKWVKLTKPFHNLSKQRQNVLALLLYYHFKYKKEITNNRILWKMVFDYDTKKLIKEELEINDQGLQNILTYFRKNNIIINEKISSVFIPELEGKENNFKIIYNFNIIHG